MPLRQRISLVAAAAVAVSIAAAALTCYWAVRMQLYDQIDGALSTQATAVQQGNIHALDGPLPGIPASAGGSAPYWQIIDTHGDVLRSPGGISLPTPANAPAIAAGQAGRVISTISAAGTELRQITFGGLTYGGQPIAIELVRPLGPTTHVLAELRLILLLLAAGGVALAAGLGRLAARRVLAPLAEVAQTAEHITETEDLSSRLRVHADDEVGQLATRFNAMIERLQHSRSALDESVQAQRQLVADASHELRTPVTSLRTNIEVLLAGGELPVPERDRLLGDVVEQTEELSALVNDLIEAARGDLPLHIDEEVRLDRVVADAVARVRRNAPGVRFESSLSPVTLPGDAERLNRAVGNLLDNAARHSPPDGLIEVTVDVRGVLVRDHGTGIEEADLPHIFDRFYRGVNSRGRQGSGLGLAIVRQIAEQHGGLVSAANAPGGGAVFTLRLPVTVADHQPSDDAMWSDDDALRPADRPAPGPAGRR